MKNQREYRARINRVMDYIEEHVEESLTLEELASVACFSKYHFARIFLFCTGETLFQFIQRIRLERAAYFLCASRDKTITEIALQAGFSGSAPFARAFRNYYGVSASSFREDPILSQDRNLGKTGSNPGKDPDDSLRYDDVNHRIRRKSMERKTPEVKIKSKGVEVRELEETAVAYVRHTGPYQGDEDLFSRLFQSLFAWAGPRGLLDQPDLKVLAVYHDNPDITDDDKLRVSVCISVPAETEVSGEVGKMVIPGGKYAFARFSVNAEEYGAAWDWTFSRWLPESGYQPDDRPCFELYQSDPKQSPDGKTDVDIVIPVKPL